MYSKQDTFCRADQKAVQWPGLALCLQLRPCWASLTERVEPAWSGPLGLLHQDNARTIIGTGCEQVGRAVLSLR